MKTILRQCNYCNEISFDGNSCLICGLDIDSRTVPSNETLEDIKFRKENNIKTQLIEWCTNIEKAPLNKKLLIIHKTSSLNKFLIEIAFIKNYKMYPYNTDHFYSLKNQEIIYRDNVVAWSDYEIPKYLLKD